MEKRQKSLRVVDVHVREIAHWHLAEKIPEQLVLTLEDGTERTLPIGKRSALAKTPNAGANAGAAPGSV